MIDLPHFTHPFRFDNGRAAVAQQNSDDDIWTCIETIVRFHKGDRIADPEFGITDPSFAEGQVDVEAIRREVEKLEDRAALVIAEHPDRFDELVRHVLIEAKGDSDG